VAPNPAASAPIPAPEEAVRRARALVAGGGRHVLGLVGPPGTGKSTLAAALCAALPGLAQVLPMDGFHLANTHLARLGRRQRQGAPDTFDAAGFAALILRVRAQSRNSEETIYAPSYERSIEEPIANAIAIVPGVPLVVVEGNYLLLDQGPWRAVAALLDQTWYIDTDDTLRRQRLQARHEQFGRTPAEARTWIEQTDEPNARLIAQGRARVDWCVDWGSAGVHP